MKWFPVGERQREGEKWSGTACQFDLSRKDKKKREREGEEDVNEKVKDTERIVRQGCLLDLEWRMTRRL